jgi:octaprenyl-diphosphate synthase
MAPDTHTPTLPQPETNARRLQTLYAPITAELAETERVYAAELGSRHSFVRLLVEHSADFRGKRLRPVLVLLSGKACGGLRPEHPVLAAVVEMIHTATLVHDDVLDEALVRRHAATVNAEWGNEAAVLMGDFLFTHAFHLAASLETTLACRWIGRATNLICEGELLQVHHRGNLDLDEATYFAIIEGKTAELTAVSCRLGAHYAGADEVTAAALDRFGRDLGIAFQIADDVLDLWGEERATGKTLGTDLEKQKLTLPLIRLLADAAPATAHRVRDLLRSPSPDRRELLPYLEASGALQSTWETAHAHARSAARALDVLPESEAREVLRSLAHDVVRRAF